MNEAFTAAAIQMTVGADKPANLAAATRLVEEAAERGARLVVLPELFNCHAPPEVMLANAEPIPGPTSEAMTALARRLNIHLVAGSIGERTADPAKMHNTSVLYSPEGKALATYPKIHLFDVDAPGRVTNRESDRVAPGADLALADTPVGVVGLGVCYDVRFPELFRLLVNGGMEILALPSAFSAATGVDHWETLVRARAIENQVYVIAANQVGAAGGHFACHGHSMIVDPWGAVLASMAGGEGVITAELDPRRLAQVRRELPVLRHRRLR